MLKLINGGFSESAATSTKKFISAYITDTRLMGVVGVYVHWKLPDNCLRTEMYQVFYLDAEEYGLDIYECIIGPDDGETMEEIMEIKNRLMGGLGGKEVEITERELRYLVRDYADMNRRQGIPLPDKPEFTELMKPEIMLTREEEYNLMSKQCEPITNDFQVVNYFIMRCAGRDFKAAKFLTKEYIRTDLFPEHKEATLLKNEIHVGESAFNVSSDEISFSSSMSYLCRSLLEYDGKFFVTTSSVTVEKLKVTKYERLTSERISGMEAEMLTDRPEYVNVYELSDEAREMDRGLVRILSKSQKTRHETGILYLVFKPNNEHVSQEVFRLNDDVLGTYYFLDTGQVVVQTFDMAYMLKLQLELLLAYGKDKVRLCSKYMFNEPVFYEFVNSYFFDFEEFVDIISYEDD